MLLLGARALPPDIIFPFVRLLIGRQPLPFPLEGIYSTLTALWMPSDSALLLDAALTLFSWISLMPGMFVILFFWLLVGALVPVLFVLIKRLRSTNDGNRVSAPPAGIFTRKL